MPIKFTGHTQYLNEIDLKTNQDKASVFETYVNVRRFNPTDGENRGFK